MVDRHWTLLAANESLSQLLVGVDEALLVPPVNVLRLSLHPDGLASRIANYREWKTHILARLEQQLENSPDYVLAGLVEELKAYPVPQGARAYNRAWRDQFAGIAVPLELITEAGVLAFISTPTVFGTPVDISLSELAIESFFPANETTAAALRPLAEPLVTFDGGD